MTIRHHPREETLVAYAAGTLKPALAAVVSCHITLCSQCRGGVRRMERVGGMLLAQARNAELAEGTLPRMTARALEIPPTPISRPVASASGATATVLPTPLARHLSMGIDDIPWKSLARGIEQFRVKMPRRDGDLRILRVQAGLGLLTHGHYGCELGMVLKGAYSDKTGEYRPGEVSDLDEDTEHRPRVTRDGECICIIAGESHPRYKSLVIRLLRPLLGF